MKYLGIDYGAKRIGLAVSDGRGIIAFPHITLDNNANVFSALKTQATEQRIEAIVIGDTRSYSGIENPVSKEADAFIERLKKETELPVEPMWEMGTSIEASRYAPEGKEHNDGAAAAIILQRYLDIKGGGVE